MARLRRNCFVSLFRRRFSARSGQQGLSQCHRPARRTRQWAFQTSWKNGRQYSPRNQANIRPQGEFFMCRNIKTLFNFEPPATEAEIRSAALQYVRKVSGFNKPSKANEAAFNRAVDEMTVITSKLLNSLETNTPPKDRDDEAAKAKARSLKRFAS